jgi:hypothetical protein
LNEDATAGQSVLCWDAGDLHQRVVVKCRLEIRGNANFEPCGDHCACNYPSSDHSDDEH